MYSLELGLGCNFKFSIKLINCEVYLQQKYAHIIMYEENDDNENPLLCFVKNTLWCKAQIYICF